MLCPNCGELLVEGHLYCDSCGYEIQIVPDFEPEIDKHILSSISSIKNELHNETEIQQEETKPRRRSFSEWIVFVFQTDKKKFAGLCIGMLALLCAVIVFIVMLAQSFSPKYQNRLGLTAMDNGQVDLAIPYFERVIELDEDFTDAYNSLFNCYYSLEMEEEAINILLLGIQNAAFNKEQLLESYDKIAAIYIKNEQYSELNTLLLECNLNAVKEKYSEFMADEVQFSFNEGSYSEVVPLKLSTTGSGNIYYTLDGSIPTTESEEYFTPIFLRNGEYNISAVVINEFGVTGVVTAKTYYIDSLTPYPPEISAYSGEYQFPTLISIDASDNCKVYYTTDGSSPTDQSLLYERPIPMPIGKSQFKFVSYGDNGVYGEVVVRNYSLALQTEYLYTDAQRDIYTLMIQNNIILDYAGTTADMMGSYHYDFIYCLHMEELGDFYVIEESYTDEQGVVTQTGIHFAVDIYSGKVYRADINENMDCVLTPFEA